MGRVGASAVRTSGRGRLRAAFVSAVLLLAVVAAAAPSGSVAEQASEPTEPAAGLLDAGLNHTCAVDAAADLRCWGFNANGQLGLGNTQTIGDDETPGSAGPVPLGEDVIDVSVGDYYTCAVLASGSVRCWGFGGNGRLGYGNTQAVGDNEAPSVNVPLPAGRTAVSISTGRGHTCARLDDQTIRCWGYAYFGGLGHGGGDPNRPPTNDGVGQAAHPQDFGNNAGETPAALPPVDFGADDRVLAVSAGGFHTCALLVDHTVRCWGYGANGQIGYPRPDPDPDPDPPRNIAEPRAEPVDLGPGRTARAISAGDLHTCAVLDNGRVLCWGAGLFGRLGFPMTQVGDNESPGSVAPVDLGEGATAEAVSAGMEHTCAKLIGGAVRCWGNNFSGQLGYGNTVNVGDFESPQPNARGPVNIGAGRAALAISAGGMHTCARLNDTAGSVLCWGSGATGRLGYCNERDVGDNEAPGALGRVPVDIAVRAPSTAYPGCARAARPAPVRPPRTTPAANPLAEEAARLRALRGCYSRAARHARGEIRRARTLGGARRARLKRHIKRHRSAKRRACLRRHGRTPGRVSGLRAEAGSRSVLLRFDAAGTDGARPPAARTYVIKQSLRPIRGRRAFRRAQTLCNGACRFPTIREVGADVSLRVRDLRRRTTYYYAVVARDNVSKRLGRSTTLRVRTR